jgi:hypothetical protein
MFAIIQAAFKNMDVIRFNFVNRSEFVKKLQGANKQVS